MSLLDRRQVFLALAALGAAAGSPTIALPQIDPEGARRIGRAYLKQHPGRLDAAGLGNELLPEGWTTGAAARLRSRVARDFRADRLFVYRGWRLSDTEGRLFALAALTPA